MDKLVKNLNLLLVEYRNLYSISLWYHWNVKSPNFLELHELFGNLYQTLQKKIDDVAERILALSGDIEAESLNFNSSEFRAKLEIKKESEMLEIFLEMITSGIKVGVAVMEEANRVNDYGTQDLVSENIREEEKLAWMIRSYLQK